jgi:hypothetical protein
MCVLRLAVAAAAALPIVPCFTQALPAARAAQAAHQIFSFKLWDLQAVLSDDIPVPSECLTPALPAARAAQAAQQSLSKPSAFYMH